MGGAVRRMWERAGQRPAQALLVIAGIAVIVGAFVQSSARNDFAKWAIAAGTVLVVAGAVAHRITEFGAGNAKVVLTPEIGRSADLAVRVSEERQHRQPVELKESDVVNGARFLAAETAIRTLLEPGGTDRLAGCTFHLYLYDAYLRQLVPTFEPDDDHRTEGWPVGVGVVGESFRTQRYVLAVQPDTWNDKFRLTPERQERYRDSLLAVCAVPVLNAGNAPIAVLSASDRTSTDRLAEPSTEDDLTAIAYALARVLVDLLAWFPDDYTDVTQEDR